MILVLKTHFTNNVTASVIFEIKCITIKKKTKEWSCIILVKVENLLQYLPENLVMEKEIVMEILTAMFIYIYM